MQATKFECQLAPVGDPTMKVEWFFNGKALPFSKILSHFWQFVFKTLIIGLVFEIWNVTFDV